METRKEELLQLQSHIKEIDAEFTLILQHLQWDRKHLLQDSPKAICKYDANHRVTQESKEIHEEQCRLAHNGYSKDDKMLPDPIDNNAKTLIKLDKNDINQIIAQASNADPSFKKGTENVGIEPQTLDRLQSTYTGDERRAIYDAVVQAAPFCHDLSDLALLSEQGQDDTSKKQKSRLEILAELRDMKRRRTKYRVAAKTRNYSDVLRDVIKTQMEVYSDVKIEKSETGTSNGNWKDDFKYDSNKSHRPNRNYSCRPSEDESDHRRKREKSRNRYDEDRPSSSKKANHYDVIDSTSKHKKHKDRRHDYDKRSYRHPSRESSRYDDQYSGEKPKDRTKDHKNYKRYEDGSSKERRKHEKRENRYSNRDQREEQYEAKSYYHPYEYESRKDKKKYSEHRK
ncbi:hypothetical protein ABMA28_013953 [Loxostege sticticalis]|uniref:CHHC U11-48K-type domain-containing protein n=1 Tax=Loxostege sticticalis TaxID=481309 RepID=A0ABD0TF06_LOXSC